MKIFVLTLVLGLALVGVGCGAITKDKAAATAAIAHFHDLYNQGKADDLWKAADAKFQAAAPQSKFTELAGAMLRKLGPVKSTANTGWSVNNVNLVTTVAMTQETVFEQGNGTETFTFKMADGQAVLLGYNIQSNDLLVK